MRYWFYSFLAVNFWVGAAKAESFQSVETPAATYRLNQSWVYVPPLTWDTDVQHSAAQDKPPAVAFFVAVEAERLFGALEQAGWIGLVDIAGSESVLGHVRMKNAAAERIYQQIDTDRQTVWSVGFWPLPRYKGPGTSSDLWLAVTHQTSMQDEMVRGDDDGVMMRLTEVLLDGEARVLDATAQGRETVPFFDIRHTALELRQWFEASYRSDLGDARMLCSANAIAPQIERLKRPAAETVFWHDDTTPNRVALTFDACSTFGHGNYNPMVIEILKRYHVPATLFIGGHWAELHPETLRDLASEPLFEIGNHSYSHPHMRELSLTAQRQELLWTQQAIFERAGVWPRFFRPPYGEVDDAMITNTADVGLETVEYDLPAGDASPSVSVNRLIRWVVDQAVPGSIVIMHMNHPTSKTALALPGIIEGLRKRGFVLSTIGQMRQEYRP